MKPGERTSDRQQTCRYSRVHPGTKQSGLTLNCGPPREVWRPEVNQVLTPEEVVALLQGVAEAELDRRKPGQAKQTKHPDNLYKAKAHRKVRRGHLVGSLR